MTPDKQSQFGQLILQALDGQLNQEQFTEFDRKLREEASFRHFYLKFMAVNASLNSVDKFPVHRELSCDLSDTLVWQSLLEAERNSPTVVIPIKPKPTPEKSPKKNFATPKATSPKFWLFTSLVSSAAIVMLLLTPLVLNRSVEVATLSDAMGVVWTDPSEGLALGSKVTNNQHPYSLEAGIIALQFNSGPTVLIEGPACFSFAGSNEISLQHGRVYSKVPPRATGFTVNTPTARVIDLGTEFGIQANRQGDVQLHVIKGETTLRTGKRSQRGSINVNGGQAKSVASTTQTVSDIPCDTELFVRNISSDRHFVWRGQSGINLADIVGGGNGFGSGEIGRGLNLSRERTPFVFTGKAQFETTDYIPVPEFNFIDGLFVPNGWQGAIQISTEGHLFQDCPVTSGAYFDEIRNGGLIKDASRKTYPMVLDGQRYGTSQNPALYMHTNAGITFDLNAIRDAVPGCKIVAFNGICGISSDPRNEHSKAHIYILIDGQLKESASITSDLQTALEINLQLTPKDRFLTLVSTEGSNKIASDWVLFARPYLSLKAGN